MGERALKYNQLLWSIIQADVAEKDNALPEELKANLMSLSIFVDKQTSKGLTNINLNIAEGLMEGA
jgi:flagellar protein FlaF